MWTVNFQMLKLDLEKAEEPEIKLFTRGQHLVDHQKSKRVPEKSSTSALLMTPKPLTVWIPTNCGKFFKRWDYHTTLPAFWEISVQVKKQQLELDMEQQTGLQIGKGVRQGCILSPCLFNLYAEYIIRTVGLDEAWAGIKIAGRNINNFRYADDTTIMTESRGTKKPLDESERDEWKNWLKTQHSEN